MGNMDIENLVVARVFGDNMTPTVTGDDTLFIDMSAPQIRDNALYAMQWDDALVVRLLRLGTPEALAEVEASMHHFTVISDHR